MNKSLILVSKKPIIIQIFTLVCKKLNIKLEVLELIRILNDKRYIPVVKSLKKHKSLEVKYAATQTLKHLNTFVSYR